MIRRGLCPKKYGQINDCMICQFYGDDCDGDDNENEDRQDIGFEGRG